MIETFLGTSHIILAGGLLEAFSPYENGNGRIPLSLLRAFSIDDTRGLFLRPRDVWGRSPFLVPVADEYREAACWFVDQVHAAAPGLARS